MPDYGTWRLDLNIVQHVCNNRDIMPQLDRNEFADVMYLPVLVPRRKFGTSEMVMEEVELRVSDVCLSELTDHYYISHEALLKEGKRDGRARDHLEQLREDQSVIQYLDRDGQVCVHATLQNDGPDRYGEETDDYYVVSM